MKKIGVKSFSSSSEDQQLLSFSQTFKENPIPSEQLFSNLGLFLKSKDLARILFLDHIYKENLEIPGVVMDFGTRWGQNMAVFTALRGLYEPFNRHRLVLGFDTFSGFPSVSKQDGNSDLMKKGNVSVTKDYEVFLEKIMNYHESTSPLEHIKKYRILKGDASIKLKNYLDKNPQTIVSLAYFDFDIYSPTKKCLTLIKPHLVKGSVIGFDEINDADSPGETLALNEVFGLNNIKLKRFKFTSRVSYFVVE